MTERRIPYLAVLYREFHPETYEGVQVDFAQGDVRVYKDKGWPGDLKDAEKAITAAGFDHYLSASSLTHFQMDLKIQKKFA